MPAAPPKPPAPPSVRGRARIDSGQARHGAPAGKPIEIEVEGNRVRIEQRTYRIDGESPGRVYIEIGGESCGKTERLEIGGVYRDRPATTPYAFGLRDGKPHSLDLHSLDKLRGLEIYGLDKLRDLEVHGLEKLRGLEVYGLEKLRDLEVHGLEKLQGLDEKLRGLEELHLFHGDGVPCPDKTEAQELIEETLERHRHEPRERQKLGTGASHEVVLGECDRDSEPCAIDLVRCSEDSEPCSPLHMSCEEPGTPALAWTPAGFLGFLPTPAAWTPEDSGSPALLEVQSLARDMVREMRDLRELMDGLHCELDELEGQATAKR